MASEKKSFAAKFLGIESAKKEDPIPAIGGVDIYSEEDPTVEEFLREITPSARDVGRYFYDLFPFLSWIGKYNVTWLIGDLIAGEFSCYSDIHISLERLC